jgi:formylglycine-generating enzyme required for sulfatase activity
VLAEVSSAPEDAGVDADDVKALPPPDCPDGMVLVGAFCIDRYEAYLVSLTLNGAWARHPHYQRPQRGVRYEARSEVGVYPQAYINRIEAEAACTNAKKRLCSLAEWQRACMGARATAYPYGLRWEANRCNMDKPHLLTLRFGPDALRWTYEVFNDPALDQDPAFLARSGEYKDCVGDTGVYDLVGNLHEWVSDEAGPAVMASLKTDGAARQWQPWAKGNGIFMGGFYSTREEHGPGCRFITVAHEPKYHDYSTGFRCCADQDGGAEKTAPKCDTP